MFQSAHSIQSAISTTANFSMLDAVSIRALHTECDARPALSSLPATWFQSAHSIQSAMATHSKISPIRALASPLSQQNRRILGNPSQLTHPCARPRREETSRFYDHLGFALEPSFGTSHSFVLRLQNFGRPRPTTFLWSNHVTQPSDAFDLTRQSIASLTFPLAHQ